MTICGIVMYIYGRKLAKWIDHFDTIAYREEKQMARRKDGFIVKVAKQTENALRQGRQAAEGTNIVGGIRAGTAGILGMIGGLISGTARFIKPGDDDEDFDDEDEKPTKRKVKKKAKRKAK
jgi:hypothetical protein